jgi:hypothetical protein
MASDAFKGVNGRDCSASSARLRQRTLEQRQLDPVIVRGERRVAFYSPPADEREPERSVKRDERVVARPRVHAKALASERFAVCERPGQDGIDEPAAGIRRRTRDAVQVDVCAPFVVAPDRRVFVGNGKHTHESGTVENAKEAAGFYFVEDRAIGELRPQWCPLLGLPRASVRVRCADLFEIGGCRLLDSHWVARTTLGLAIYRQRSHSLCATSPSSQLVARASRIS